MKVTILGCGPSYGVPALSRGFYKCDPENPKNTRFRSSILIEENGQNILVDTPPEIRLELLRAKVKKIDALIYTHSHFDHIAGAEDVYNLSKRLNRVLNVYGSSYDLNNFKKQLEHVFKDPKQKNNIVLHPVKMHQEFAIKGITILPIKQYHGTVNSVGYRIGKLAYSTDVKLMDKKGWEILKGIDTWILGCVTDRLNEKHICLREAMDWIQKVHPKKAYLTHLGNELDYDELCQKLPPNVKPVYDGMTIKINT